MFSLRSHVLSARQQLSDGQRRLRRLHAGGAKGVQVCAATAELWDEVIRTLFESALDELARDEASSLPRQVALVAHGGYGRRELAPFSDVDLMLLRGGEDSTHVAMLSERLMRDVCDAGFVLGYSVRTTAEACRLAVQDVKIGTSLMESRLLAGDQELFDQFRCSFHRRFARRGPALCEAIGKARAEERHRYGETVYLLEPNLKRSRGGLRDLHLLRWIGLARYGTAESGELHRLGELTDEDVETLARASEFLLRLRNELHFRAGRAADVLDRGSQIAIAKRFGHQASEGMLPVEHFMRDYFRHTHAISHIVERFAEKANARRKWGRALDTVASHRVGQEYRVGPNHIRATSHGLSRLRTSLLGVMQLVELANLYNKPIAPETWDVIRHVAPTMRGSLSPETRRRFLSLLGHSSRLGPLLCGLHEVGLLEEFVPALEHARGLLQFNQYHKYTVDEHCLRAVEWATALTSDPGPLGRVYQQIKHKRLLHLALLIHDLGKGYPEDHSETGLRIARETALRLGLSADETETLEFLVHKHLLMNHFALRRDIDDEALAVQLAVEVGSPERLRMMYVLTAADLGAVGPDTWTEWKSEVLTILFHRAMEQLAGESPATELAMPFERVREEVASCLGPKQHHPRIRQQLHDLPTTCLHGMPPEQIAEELGLLEQVDPGHVLAKGRYLDESATVQFTVVTREHVVPGIFHRLTGALTGAGLQILSAQINTLAGGLVLDRFWAHDPDFVGNPPPERFAQIEEALVDALLHPETPSSTFRRTWQTDRVAKPVAPQTRTRVEIDNATSKECTVLDVFAVDRPGLLHVVARAIYELELSVWRAKVGTFLDQVVDVFYVTDQNGEKIVDETRLHSLRKTLFDVIESYRPQHVLRPNRRRADLPGHGR